MLFSSVAAYNLTPILTSPNDTEPFQIERMNSPRRSVGTKNGRMHPMLATAVSTLPSEDGWAFEFKWDGVRTLLDATDQRVRLISRAGNDVSAGYPELVAQAAHIG